MRKNIIEGKHTKMLIVALFVIFLATAIIFKVFSIEIFPSQFYGAMIGVVITALITMLLLEGQTASEKERNKDVRVFEQKIRVFSEFTKKMWSTINEENFSGRNILELKKICFQELIFELNKNDINEITKQIKKIDPETGNITMFLCEITEILKNILSPEDEKKDSKLKNKENKNTYKQEDGKDKNVHMIKDKGSENVVKLKSEKEKVAPKSKENEKPPRTLSESILNLSNAFEDLKVKWDVLAEKETEEIPLSEKEKVTKSIKLNETTIKGIQFWHFNMLNDAQIEAFKNRNWKLSLVEWGETWRTNLIRQTKKGDVVFLFRRGGNGYIGAFKVIEHKILESESFSEDYLPEDDIYNGMKEGASLSSNLIVEPIAYNYKGVGYYTVRRRTIERMNDLESVKFLLNRFKGNDLPENFIDGKDKLDVNTSIKKEDIDFKYFEKLIKEDTSGQ